MPALKTSVAEIDTRELILARAISLFANRGYEGVSMRDLGALVGISAAALYHHFPDKQALYVAAVSHAFARTQQGVRDALQSALPPIERLRCFVMQFTALVAADDDFRRLLQRELLDGDEGRLALLAHQVFREPHGDILALARELSSDLDPYLLTLSVVGQVVFSVQSAPLSRYLQGGRARHRRPEVIAEHIVTLLTRALLNRDAN